MKCILFFSTLPSVPGKCSKSVTDGVTMSLWFIITMIIMYKKMYEKNSTGGNKRRRRERRRGTTEIIIIIIIIKRKRACNKSRRAERRRGEVYERTNDYNSRYACLATDLTAKTQRVNGLREHYMGKKRCFFTIANGNRKRPIDKQ